MEGTGVAMAEWSLSSRQRGRLRRAREEGYLEVRAPDGAETLRVHGAWCWRLRLPVVWWERISPRSRYGRVRLDLLTTAERLTEVGHTEMGSLAPWVAAVSRDDATWDRVPLGELRYLAGRVLHAAVRPGNRETALPRRIHVDGLGRRGRRGAKVVAMDPERQASA
jgi:hypothetical protein